MTKDIKAQPPLPPLFIRFREFTITDEVINLKTLGKYAVQYAELFGWALAPEKIHAFEVRHTSEWLKWAPGMLDHVGDSLPATAVAHRTASILWDGNDRHFIQVPYDCTTENASDSSVFRTWKPLTFGRAPVQDSQGTEPIWLIGGNLKCDSLGPASSDTWQTLLDPAFVRMGWRDTAQTPVHGLAGDLALLFGLTAFQVGWKDLLGYIPQSFAADSSNTSVPPWALDHAINTGLYRYRGLVVDIAIDSDVVTRTQLERWELGAFGPILRSSPMYDLHKVVPRQSRLTSRHSPDTEADVASQTDGVWKDMVYLTGNPGNRAVLPSGGFKLIFNEKFSHMRVVVVNWDYDEAQASNLTEATISQHKFTSGETRLLSAPTTIFTDSALGASVKSASSVLNSTRDVFDQSFSQMEAELSSGKHGIASMQQRVKLPETKEPSPLTERITSDMTGVEILSIASLPDDIQSCNLRSVSLRLLEAESETAQLLMGSEEFSLLCKASVKAAGIERFRRQLIRLFKYYYVELMTNARTTLQKSIADRLLRSRWSRGRIAGKCIGHIVPDMDDQSSLENKLGASTEAKVIFEKWLHGLEPDDPSDATEDTNLPDGGTVLGFEDDNEYLGYESDSTHSDSLQSYVDYELRLESEDADLNRLGEMTAYLMDGAAFSNMFVRLGRLLIPSEVAALIPSLCTIPADRIDFQTRERRGWINELQCRLESFVGERWNWWPLQPPRRALRRTEVRMLWTCHCGTLRWMEIPEAHLAVLKLMLENATKFVSNKARVCRSTSEAKRCRPCSDQLDAESGVVVGVDNEVPHTLTPKLHHHSDKGTFSTGGVQAHQSANTDRHGTGQLLKSTGLLINPPSGTWSYIDAHPVPTGKDGGQPIPSEMYIILGVNGKRATLDVENINYYVHQEDFTFFAEIKTNCRRFRGFWRHYFSVFVLDHCDFSKFEKIRANRVICRGRGLPNQPEYIYTPRPPDADMPPVDQHEFQMGFNPCRKSCWLSLFHDCIEEAEGYSAMSRIPKRTRALNVEASGQETVWGLEARFNISFVRMLFYHVLILAGPMGFWTGWQVLHPGDYQNASVPVMATFSLLSLWWTTFGVWKIQKENRR